MSHSKCFFWFVLSVVDYIRQSNLSTSEFFRTWVSGNLVNHLHDPWTWLSFLSFLLMHIRMHPSGDTQMHSTHGPVLRMYKFRLILQPDCHHRSDSFELLSSMMCRCSALGPETLETSWDLKRSRGEDSVLGGGVWTKRHKYICDTGRLCPFHVYYTKTVLQ